MSENTTPAANEARPRGRRKTLIGTVVSNKMDKTAVVSVERRRPHPLYRKIVRSTKRYKAHDPRNEAVLGDVVRIEETRPLSKDKRWRIVETLARGNVAEIAPREIGVPELLEEEHVQERGAGAPPRAQIDAASPASGQSQDRAPEEEQA